MATIQEFQGPFQVTDFQKNRQVEKRNISNAVSSETNSYENMLLKSLVSEQNKLVGYAISSEDFENLTEEEAFEKMAKILDSFSSR